SYSEFFNYVCFDGVVCSIIGEYDQKVLIKLITFDVFKHHFFFYIVVYCTVPLFDNGFKPHYLTSASSFARIAAARSDSRASAIPWYVLLRIFQRSGEGPSLFCPLSVWFAHRFLPSTIRGSTYPVCWRGGKFLSHRHVALLASSPNWCGWIICVGGSMRVEI